MDKMQKNESSRKVSFLGILPGRKKLIFFLLSLLAYYFYSADFEFQAAFVELVFRLIPCDIRQAKAKEYFRIDSVSQAFSDILNEEFEAVSKK